MEHAGPSSPAAASAGSLEGALCARASARRVDFLVQRLKVINPKLLISALWLDASAFPAKLPRLIH